MNIENKYTIQKSSEVSIEIKKSKFLGFSYFVKTKKEALDIIEKHKEKYRDATHNCFGYIIKENIDEGFSDDFEPSKTAGYPILEYLKNNSYEYTLVIVTRYFGGTLLGTGGLVRAYTECTKNVLDGSGKYLVGEGYYYTFKISYKELDNINRYLEENKIIKRDEKFLEEIEITIEVLKDELEKIEKDLTNILKRNIEKIDVVKQLQIIRKKEE